jgi:hypothetical protein
MMRDFAQALQRDGITQQSGPPQFDLHEYEAVLGLDRYL